MDIYRCKSFKEAFNYLRDKRGDKISWSAFKDMVDYNFNKAAKTTHHYTVDEEFDDFQILVVEEKNKGFVILPYTMRLIFWGKFDALLRDDSPFKVYKYNN